MKSLLVKPIAIRKTFDISSLCLSVLIRKAPDIISKAVSRSLKSANKTDNT